MSYPAEVRTLIIEDDPEMIDQYRRIFDYLRERYALLGIPAFSESYTDAEVELKRPHIYHIVVLDLRLPDTIGAALGEVVARGLGLIPAIAAREDYPVPILMIVTADPTRIIDRPELDEQLRSAFWRQWVISKNDKLAEQLVPAVEAALAYSRVGVHIVGDASGDELWPMLSPREEDILRRAILDPPSTAIGADLRWWSRERDPLVMGRPTWTKVLRGKLILSGQDGFSRERFLKFVSAEEGEPARRSAQLLGSKLPHGQVVRYLSIGSRALLITEKAGPNESPPRPLGAVVKQSEPLGAGAIERIAQDIVDQLCMLGDSTPSTTSVPSVLWKSHDEQRLVDAWSRICSSKGLDPVSMLRELRGRTETLIVTKRLCHGDLHPGNVSISEDDGKLRAYIIDAGVMSPEISGKDVAVLEISILLHVDFGEAIGPIASMTSLFDGSDPYGKTIEWQKIHPEIENAIRLVLSLRNRVHPECDEKTYILLLFDYLLIQIGGVAFGSAYNKIISMSDLVLLFQHLTRWYRKLYP